MAIKVLNDEPDPSVLKQVICGKCGVKLEYAPIDVKYKTYSDYSGGSDTDYYLPCPKCKTNISVSRPKCY